MTFLLLAGAGIITILLFVLFIILLPILALISVLMNDFKGNDKIIWVLVIIVLPILGSLIYFLVGRGKRI